MKHKNYFEYMEGILRALESGGKNKLQIAAAMGASHCCLSQNPARKALAALVESGKVLKQGGAFILASAPIKNRGDINATLQSALAAFLESVVQVVSQDYDKQLQTASRNLSEAYSRVSELTQELAALKYEKSRLPNVLQKLQEKM